VRPGMRLKASTFRSYVKLITEDGRRDAVMAIVPSATAALIATPPLAGTWMDFWHIIHISQAIETLAGMPAVRDLARRGTDDARKPYMGIAESMLKLFGTSPATLYKRMNALVSSFIEGLDYQYTSSGLRAGTMQVTYGHDEDIPLCVFFGGLPALQQLLETCGVKGVVGAPERLSANKVRYHIQW
jgi:hypothetical protein